jgi:gas vesicle protein
MADEQGNGGDKLVYFLIGAGIGAITALLFAPKAGSELRSDIAERTKKGLDYARDTGRDLSDRASEYYHTGVERAQQFGTRVRDDVGELTERVKEDVGDLAERSRDVINRQKAQFAAAIEAGKQGYREAKQSDQAKISAAIEEK